MPSVWLEVDHERDMAAHGLLVGFSRARAVWRFGFPAGSALARAFGIEAAAPRFVLTLHNGSVIETFDGAWGADPPSRMKNILEASL